MDIDRVRQNTRSQSASKLFDNLMLLLKEFFEKIKFEKYQQTTRNHEKFQARKVIMDFRHWLRVFYLRPPEFISMANTANLFTPNKTFNSNGKNHVGVLHYSVLGGTDGNFEFVFAVVAFIMAYSADLFSRLQVSSKREHS